MPAGFRLPAALMSETGSSGADDAVVLDRIAGDFLDQVDPVNQPEGTPAAGDPGTPGAVLPENWAEALRMADAQYRTIYGYQKADRALREAAIDAMQSNSNQP